MLRRVLVSVVVAAVVASCGSDDAERDRSMTPTSATSTTSAASLTSTDICRLVTGDRVESTLGSRVSATNPAADGAPSCRYRYEAAGEPADVELAVLRPEELDGATGTDAYDAALRLGREAAGVPSLDEELAGVGDAAHWWDGSTSNVLVASRDDRVVAVHGPRVTQEQAAGLALMLLSA